MGTRGLVFADLDGLWRFSKYVAASGLAPKGITTPEAIFVAIQMGLEVGLTPMAALQNIAVINGRPSIWGDAQLAVVRSTGDLTEFSEWYEVDGKRLPRNPTAYPDNLVAVCRVQRRGYAASEQSFSVADAKSADLWGKVGPWKQYPSRMLRMRARSFALRDQFGDALRGLRSTEEAMDGPTIEVETETVARNIPPTESAPPQATVSEPAPAATTKPKQARAAKSATPSFAQWCADRQIGESDALNAIHRLWPATETIGSLDDIEKNHPAQAKYIVEHEAEFIAEVKAN